MLLVDSSVYIDWLRARIEPHRRLEPWIRGQKLCSCGIVRAEVLRGVVDELQRERVADLFAIIPEVPCDGRLWAEAADLAWRLDRQGCVLPLTDIVIASCALRVGAAVITTDHHFSNIPGLISRRALPKTRAE